MNPYCQTNLKLAIGFPLRSYVYQSTRHESDQHGKIFLYEELPSNERILEKELKIWMQNQEDDATIDLIFDDQAEGANCSPVTRNFYRHIKQECLKIVFNLLQMDCFGRESRLGVCKIHVNANWYLKTLSKGGGFLQQAIGDITTLTAKMFCPKISIGSLRSSAKSVSWEFLAEHIRIFEVRMTHAAGSDLGLPTSPALHAGFANNVVTKVNPISKLKRLKSMAKPTQPRCFIQKIRQAGIGLANRLSIGVLLMLTLTFNIFTLTVTSNKWMSFSQKSICIKSL